MRQLLRGGAIFDGDRWLETGHALIVEDGRILDIGGASLFEGFSGPCLELTGMTLLPGLIDCHTHLCFGAEAEVVTAVSQLRPSGAGLQALQHAQRALQGGITTLRDLGGYEYAEIAARDAIAKGRHPGPTIVCAGKMICMTGGHGWFVGIEADGAEAVVRAVRTNIKAGADCIKFMATGGVLTPGVDPLRPHFTALEIDALVGEAKRLGRHTAVHATGAAGIAQAVDAGVTSVEHGFELTEEIIEKMIAQGTWLVPTLSAMGVVRRRGMSGLPAYVAERVGRLSELHRESVRRYYAAGGRIAMGTDAGTPFNMHGENAQELDFMVELGIEPTDALRAATASAADLLGLPDRGRLRQGARADLLIVRGSPLEHIGAVSDPRQHQLVVKDGKIVQRPALEAWTLPHATPPVGTAFGCCLHT
jgi:imidazolonepropionase-like amidohydrolase